MENKINVQNKYNRIFIFPALLFLLLVGVFPLFYIIGLSLVNYALNRPYDPVTFVGLGNYITLFQDVRFLESIQKTFIYMVVTTSGSIVIGFIMAYLIWVMKENFVKSTLKVLWALPVFCAPVIIGHGFRYMFQVGPLNKIFSALHIFKEAPLGNYPDAFFAIMVTDIWYWAPFCYLILLAGLYSVPDSRLEASHTDGAWAFQRLRYTILPSLKSYFLVILLIRLMDSWRAYDFINCITKGGPGYTTETLSKYTFMNAFTWWKMGYAGSIGIFMLFITLFLTWFIVAGIPTIQKIRDARRPKEKGKIQIKQESKWLLSFNYDQYVKGEDNPISRDYIEHTKKARSRKRIKRIIYEKITIFLQVFFSIVVLFPFLFIVRSGFMTNADSLALPIKWIFKPTFENFHFVLFENSVMPYLLTTLIIAVVVTVLTLIIGVPCAYGLARYKWKFSKTTFFFILTTRMGAPIVFGIPYYMLANIMNILDSYLIMIIIYLLMNLGFAIWILKGFFEGIPRELDEISFLQGTKKPLSFVSLQNKLFVLTIISHKFSEIDAKDLKRLLIFRENKHAEMPLSDASAIAKRTCFFSVINKS